MSHSIQELINELKGSKTVEEFLNTVDYSNDPNYVPSDFALHFVAFIKLVNGEEGESHQTPVTHYKMLDSIAKGGRRVANLCHRGLGKTTLLKEYLILYLAVFNKLPNFRGLIQFGLYVSDSVDNGVKNMRKNLEFRWDNSEFLKQYLPVAKFTDIEYRFINADGIHFVIKAYGARTGVRGTRALNMRPQFALLDDLVSDEDARSATVIAAIEDTVHKAVTKALDPSGNFIIWSGTPFNSRDPLYKAIESGTWEVNVFPVCEVFPCEKKEFRGSWEDRFTYEYVLEEYVDAVANGRLSDFNQELMLRIMSEEDKVIFEEDIRWYKRTELLKYPHHYNWYITTDFATTAKQSSDYSVISVWAVNSNNEWFWVDGYRERILMNENLDNLFKLVRKYDPLGVGIEVSGQQGGFISLIRDKMNRENTFFNLSGSKGREGIHPTKDKHTRFMMIVPMFKQGKIHYPIEAKHTAVITAHQNELSLVSITGFKSKNDDTLDTISMIPEMNAIIPSSETNSNQTQNYDDDNVYGNFKGYNEEPSIRDSYVV